MRKETRREKERNKAKERRKRGNRKYGQAKLKHAKRGVQSCVLALIVFGTIVGMLLASYYSAGTMAPFIGGMAIVALILTISGCTLGFRGFREREKNYLTCKIGIGFHIFFILVFIAIFCRGLF